MRIEIGSRSAHDVLMAFADCYMNFVRRHRHRWLAVFEVDMPDMTASLPNQEFIDRLFGFLESAIARHTPSAQRIRNREEVSVFIADEE